MMLLCGVLNVVSHLLLPGGAQGRSVLHFVCFLIQTMLLSDSWNKEEAAVHTSDVISCFLFYSHEVVYNLILSSQLQEIEAAFM